MYEFIRNINIALTYFKNRRNKTLENKIVIEGKWML